MALVRGVTQRVMSMSQLKLLKEFDSDLERRIWLREKDFRVFGRITVDGIRHNVWFNPKMIDKRRVSSHFKREMKI